MSIEYYRIANVILAINQDQVFLPKKLKYAFQPFIADSLREDDRVLNVSITKNKVEEPSQLKPCYLENVSGFYTRFGTTSLPTNSKIVDQSPDDNQMSCCYYSRSVSSNEAVCARLFLSSDQAVIDVCADYKNESNYCQLISMALWAVFGTWALKHHRLFLHSSVTVVGEKAILFLGESGIGKSTQSSLWQKYIPGSWLLNDDSPMIYVDPNKCTAHGEADFLVYGTPWSGKTSCFHSLGAPIGCVVRISRGSINKVTSLTPANAFAALQPSVPPMFNCDEKLTDFVCTILSDLITEVDCNHLVCTPTKEAVICLQQKML